MGKVTVELQTFDEWLEANAHFGAEKLAAATGTCGASAIRNQLCRIGVKVRDVRRGMGLSPMKTPEGEAPPPPTPPPVKPTGKRLSADPAERVVETQLAAARDEITVLRRERQVLLGDQGRQQTFFEEVLAAIPRLEPAPRIKRAPRTKRSTKPKATLLLGTGDWHTGEVVSQEQTAGWGDYNWPVQQSRINRFTEQSVAYIETLRHGYDIDDCVVFFLGDGVSGDIHHELSVTNEWPAPEQALRGGMLLGEMIADLAPRFDTVRLVYITQSNHGRLTKKPRYKDAGIDTHDFSMAHFARMALSKHDNVSVDIRTESKALVDVAGWKFLLEHGDAYQAWMQIPHYGIQRGVRSEAWRRMGHEGTEFDYLVMGHWHFPFSIEAGRVFGVGSPKGTCEFTLKKGYVSGASQTAWLVGHHGVFARTDFNLEE